jgi:hypothetical protein
MVYFTNSIAAPTNITNMFIKLLNEINKTDRAIIHIGISALCWSIFCDKQNDTIFLHVVWLAVAIGCNRLLDSNMVLLLPANQREPMDIKMQPVGDGRT